jgi:hypothetical protein
MHPTLRFVLWAGAALTLLATVAGLALLWMLVGAAHGNVDIRVNGAPLLLHDWGGWPQLPAWQPALGAAAWLLGAVVLLVALPVVFLTMLLLGAVGGALGLAGVLLALGLVALLALSPLWLVALALWLILRRRGAPLRA